MSDGLTMEKLREFLFYDPITGIFTFKKTAGSRAAGAVAGSPHCQGYVEIRLNRGRYLAHRLAWFYVRGNWPADFIDHKDRNRANNAIENLREASDTENKRNNSAAGYFQRPNGRWTARIKIAGKDYSLGTYSTVEEAIAARAAACNAHFGEFSSYQQKDAVRSV